MFQKHSERYLQGGEGEGGYRIELTKRSGYKDFSTWHFVRKSNCSQRTSGLNNLGDKVQKELRSTGSITHDRIEGRIEIAKTVSGPLTEDRNHQNLNKPPSAAVRQEERSVCLGVRIHTT